MPERLICLLPVRNAAADLPGYFASVRRFCDGVVALDDGSTDGTRALLEAEPLVQVILENPRREDYRGWDDAANRNRTLAAAAALEPGWLISLDADERVDEADAAALRDFLETDALPGCAYGFRHVPMRGGPGQFLPKYQWIYRLFAYEPGQRFPNQRLHFVPIPTSIPRRRWLRTTIRVQHLGGMTAERRLVRFAKYLEADPNRTYQADYAHLLAGPDPVALRTWTPRPPGLPVLLAPGAPGDAGDDMDLVAEDGADGRIAISAIVIARHNPATIARTVASVAGQICPEPFETIVVVSGSAETAAIVRREFPEVELVELAEPVLPGAARNAGLKLARGRYVSFPGSHVELPPGSLAARLAAHGLGYAMVTGVTRNGNTSRAGWASYFLDHHAGLPGHRRARLDGPPAHCSYARLPLLEVGAFPDDVRTGEDTAVNKALVRRGYVALREPAVELTHSSPCRTVGRLVRHHFARGQGWGRLFLADARGAGPVLTRETWRSRGPAHLGRRLRRIAADVAVAEPDLADRYRAVRPLVALGAGAAWLGMWWEILRPAPGKVTVLAGGQARTVLLAATDAGGDARILVLRLDLTAGMIQTIPLSQGLLVGGADGASQPLGEAVAGAMAGEPAGRLERVRALVERSIHVPLDDYLVGRADDLRELLGPVAEFGGYAGEGPLTPPAPLPLAAAGGRREHVSAVGRWAGAWLKAVGGRGGIMTSLSALELAMVASEVRKLTPIAIRAVAQDPGRRLGNDREPGGQGWMP